jgi:hypothetical protein
MAIPPTQAEQEQAAKDAAAKAGLDKLLGESSEKAKESQDRIAEWSKSIGTSTLDALNSFETLENALGAIVGRAETGVADFGIGAIKKFINTVESKSLMQGTKQTSDFIQEVTGMNAIAAENSVYGINNASKMLSDAAYKTANDYGKANITLLNGVTLNASTLLGDAKELYAGFKDAVLNDTRLFNAGVKGMSYDILENIKLTDSALKVQPQQLNEIFQRELSATGEISGEMLKTYQKTALAVGQATGQVPAMIAKDLTRMLDDFNHFGAITIPQMGSLSATLHQMGLEIDDVTKLADNFSSFDKAVQTMSNLSATTGATLDTLGLFDLANTDQEQFIISLRDQLESQGVEFENMNILQQKQIASAFGIDATILQRLLSDNFDTIESANAEIEGRVSEMSDETMRSQLADMGGLVKAAEALSSKDLIERQLALESASAKFAKSIENSFRSTVMVTDKAVDAMDGARQKAFDGLNQIFGVLNNISDKGNEIFSRPSGVAAPAARPAPTGPTVAPAVVVPAPQPAPPVETVSSPAPAPPVDVPLPTASVAAPAPMATDAAATEAAFASGRSGANQTAVVSVSPAGTSEVSPPASETPAATGGPTVAPAAAESTASAATVTHKVVFELRVESGGGALADALTPLIALNLQNGTSANGQEVTFKAAAPTDIASGATA